MEVSFNIGSLEIGGDRTFIISEIGNNHNGSLERAFEMVDDSIEFGADCVKFQMRNLDEVYRKRSLIKDGEDLGTEYIIDLLQKFELSADEHKKIAEYCDKKNISSNPSFKLQEYDSNFSTTLRFTSYSQPYIFT